MTTLCAGFTRINPFCKQRWTAALLVLSTFSLTAAGLDWPADHLLPAFPAPAATIDCIELKAASGPEADLFASLEGIINRTQPRIACAGPRDGEGEVTWLKIHRLPFQTADGFDTLEKYKSEVNGLVVDDPDRPETLNLATTL